MTLTKLVAFAVITASAPICNAQWAETVYSYSSLSGQVCDGNGAIALVTGDYDIHGAVQDYYVITGDSTQDPSWRMFFANLCNNTWWVTRDWTAVHMSAGDHLVVKEPCEYRWGANAFSRTNPSATAERYGGTNSSPGYKVATGNLYCTITAGQGGDG